MKCRMMYCRREMEFDESKEVQFRDFVKEIFICPKCFNVMCELWKDKGAMPAYLEMCEIHEEVMKSKEKVTTREVTKVYTLAQRNLDSLSDCIFGPWGARQTG